MTLPLDLHGRDGWNAKRDANDDVPEERLDRPPTLSERISIAATELERASHELDKARQNVEMCLKVEAVSKKAFDERLAAYQRANDDMFERMVHQAQSVPKYLCGENAVNKVNR